MKVKITSFVLFLMGFLFIIPHFPSMSYGLARFIDICHLAILSLLSILFSIFNKSKLRPHYSFVIILGALVIYSLLIIAGNINSYVEGYGSLGDLSDLYRPILWIFSLFVGMYLYLYVGINKLFQLIQFISIVSLGVAILQKAGFNIFYLLYSGPGHIISNRATGIAQDFADYSLIQLLGAVIFFIKFENTRKTKNLVLSMILCFSVLLSTSKAGLGLMFGILIYVFYRTVFSDKTSKLFKYLLFFFVALIIIGGYLFILSDDSFYTELSLLLVMDAENLPSIAERIYDFNFVYDNILHEFSINTLVGLGASSSISDAYIEVAWLTVLYRTGLLGLTIYYSMFIFMITQLYHHSIFKIVAILLICAVFVDVFAAMTNRLVGMNLLFILFGFFSIYREETSSQNYIVIDKI